MFKWLTQLLRKVERCDHGGGLLSRQDYDLVSTEVVGATLGRDLLPTRLTRSIRRCRKCGQDYEFRGVLPRSIEDQFYAHCYDESGWPVDEAGNRLPIAD